MTVTITDEEYQAPEVLVPVKDYDEFVRVKRIHGKMEKYIQHKIDDLVVCLKYLLSIEVNGSTDNDYILAIQGRVKQFNCEIAQLEELLK